MRLSCCSLQQSPKEVVISGHCLAQRHWGAKWKGERVTASISLPFALTQLCQPLLVSPSVMGLVPAGASGPVKVAAHVRPFIFSGCWDKGSDSLISYPTKQSPNTSSERTRNNPREQRNSTSHMPPNSPGLSRRQSSSTA